MDDRQLDPDDVLPVVGVERAENRARVLAARRRDRLGQARASALLSVLVVLAGFLVAATSTEDPFPTDAFGILEAGALEQFDRDLDEWVAVPRGGDVVFASPVRTLEDAEARLRIRAGTVTLAADSIADVLPGRLDLQRGAALFDVDIFQLALTPEFVARADGAWRIETLPRSPRVGLYAGNGSALAGDVLAALGAEATVLESFQELRVEAGALGEVRPLVYTVDDPWDAEHAADLLAVDDVVARAAGGIEATYGTAERPTDFYTAFTVVDDEIELALDRFDTLPGDGFGPPADVLVAVLVTRLISERGGIDFAAAIEEVDAGRAEGATWGHVLVRRDLRADDFVGALDLSLREIAQLGEDAPPPAPPAPEPTPEPTPTPTPTQEPTEEPTQEPTQEPTEEPTEPQIPPDSCDQPGQQCAEDLVEELVELVEDLLPPAPTPLGRLGGVARMLVGSLLLRR